MFPSSYGGICNQRQEKSSDFCQPPLPVPCVRGQAVESLIDPNSYPHNDLKILLIPIFSKSV